MRITEMPANWISVSKNDGASLIALNHDEQRELLETLARMHDFTLVDREERKALQSLVTEIEDARAATVMIAIPAGQALARAVSSCFENDQEV